jgi:hypothetical protein
MRRVALLRCCGDQLPRFERNWRTHWLTGSLVRGSYLIRLLPSQPIEFGLDETLGQQLLAHGTQYSGPMEPVEPLRLICVTGTEELPNGLGGKW